MMMTPRSQIKDLDALVPTMYRHTNLGFFTKCGIVFKDDNTTQIDQYYELNMGPSKVRHTPGGSE